MLKQEMLKQVQHDQRKLLKTDTINIRLNPGLSPGQDYFSAAQAQRSENFKI